MNVKRVVLHNFLPFEDANLDLTKDGVYNLVGKNGAGKSSVREAISWCLFGKSRTDGAGDDLIHNNEKEMYVVVEFEHDGKEYTVTRQKERGQSTRLTVEEK